MNREQRKQLLEGMRFARWGEWERMFAIIPRQNINGKYIFGKVWKRTRYGSVTGEYDPKTHSTPVYSTIDSMYANNKDVFTDRLKDKDYNDT